MTQNQNNLYPSELRQLGFGKFSVHNASISSNPCLRCVTVKLPLSKNELSVLLIDSRGNILRNEKIYGRSEHQIELKEMAPGLYVLQLESVKGISSYPFVKK